MPWKRKKENTNKERYRRYNRKRKSADTESICKDSNNQHTSKTVQNPQVIKVIVK